MDDPVRAPGPDGHAGVPGPGDRAGPAAGEPATGSEAAPWRLRIGRHGLVAPAELINHPENYKGHPEQQREAVRAAIDELGFVGEILVSTFSGRILDGHLRVAEALRAGQPLVPVGWVDCENEEEEAAIIATHDPLGAMATADKQQLAALAEKANLSSDPLKAMLGGLTVTAARRGPAPAGAFAGSGGRLGVVPDPIHPVVVECDSEQEAEALLEDLADDGHRAYLLPPSPSALEPPTMP